MVHGVTTEWDDVQVKMGNYKPRPHVATSEEIFNEQINMMEHYDNKQIMNDRQIEEMAEDDIDFDDEDEFMKQYKAERMAQL